MNQDIAAFLHIFNIVFFPRKLQIKAITYCVHITCRISFLVFLVSYNQKWHFDHHRCKKREKRQWGYRETPKTGKNMLLFTSVGALRHISCCKCIHIHTYNQCQQQTDSVKFASGPNPPGGIVQLKNSDRCVKLETFASRAFTLSQCGKSVCNKKMTHLSGGTRMLHYKWLLHRHEVPLRHTFLNIQRIVKHKCPQDTLRGRHDRKSIQRVDF